MSQGYEVKPVRKEDVEDIMDLLRRTFFIDEPMNQAVGLCSDGTCTELEEYCKHYLTEEELHFKAVDAEGNIVGVIVNGISPIKEETGDPFSEAKKCQNQKFQKILYVLAKRELGSKIWEKFPKENQLVDIKVTATDPQWRKRGIMNALVKETENLTRQRGIRILRLDCSSAFSAMSAERMGFTCLYSAPYKEIKMDGQPLIVPEPPHVDDRVYVKIIE